MNRFYSKKFLFNIAAVIVSILAVITVLRMNLSSADSYYEFQLKSESSSIEQAPINLQIKTPNEDDVIPISRDLKEFVLHNRVKFQIENRALDNDYLRIYSNQAIDFTKVRIESITVYGKSGDQFFRKGTVSSKELNTEVTYNKNSILIDKAVSKQLSKFAYQNWGVKLFLCFTIIGLTVCFIYLKKNKYSYTIVFLFFTTVSFFVLNTRDTNFYGKSYYYNAGEKKESTLAPDQQFKQEFKLPEKKLTSVNFQLTFPENGARSNISQNPEVLAQLLDKTTNTIVDEKYIFYPNENDKPIEVSLHNTNEKKSNKNDQYEVVVKNISSDKQEVILPLVTESSEIIGRSSNSSGKLELTILFNKYSVKKIGMIFVFLTLFCFLLLVFGSTKIRDKSYLILIFYIIGISIFGIQVKIEQDTVEGIWDPEAHLSYIASLEATETNFLPDYRNQTMTATRYATSTKIIDKSGNLSGVIDLVEGNTNYQGHPPLYHQLLRFFGGVNKIDDTHVSINYTKLLTISNIISLLSVLIWFIIGFLYIKREPIYHWLYITLIISSSILIYGSSQLGNDVIGLLSLGLTVFALFGLAKKNYTLLNYVALTLGISIGLLTKVNVGAVVVITAGLFLIQKLFQKEYKIILNWKFLVTIPIYIVPLYFYLKMHSVFGTFMQSFANIDPIRFYNGPFYVQSALRSPVRSLGDFIHWFYRSLLDSFTYQPLEKVGTIPISFYTVFAQMSLVVFFAFFLIKVKSWGDKWLILRYTSFASGIFLINLYLNTYNRYYQDGYPGGVQGRYFLYAIPVIALAVTWGVQSILDKQNRLYDLEKQLDTQKRTLSQLQINGLFIVSTVILYDGFLFPYIFQ